MRIDDDAGAYGLEPAAGLGGDEVIRSRRDRVFEQRQVTVVIDALSTSLPANGRHWAFISLAHPDTLVATLRVMMPGGVPFKLIGPDVITGEVAFFH